MRVPVCACTGREVDVGDIETIRDVDIAACEGASEGGQAMGGLFAARVGDLHLRYCRCVLGGGGFQYKSGQGNG
jgi:hypothetical protein